MLLPVYSVQVPDSLTEDAADAASIRRSTNLYHAALGTEDNLTHDVTPGDSWNDALSRQGAWEE